MFIVREVNKSIAKTLAWCHSQSTVIGILAYRNVKIEQLVFSYFIDRAYLKTIKDLYEKDDPR